MKLFIALLCFVCTATVPVKAQSVESIIAGLQTDKQKADTLFYFASANMMKGKSDSAEYWINKGLVFALNTSDAEQIARYYCQQSNIAFNKVNYNKALDLLGKAHPYISDGISVAVKSKYLLLNAKCYRELAKFDSAIYYYQLCENLNNKNNPYRNYLVYLEKGLIFDEADSYIKAEENFIKAYALTKAKGIRMDHGIVLLQFADFYYKWKVPEKYARLLAEHQEFVAAGKKDYSKDPVHSFLLKDFGNIPVSQKAAFMQSVAEALIKESDFKNASVAFSQASALYENDNQPAVAMQYMQQSFSLAEKGNSLSNQYIFSKAIYRLLKKAGKKEEAITAADKTLALKDSMIKIQQRDLASDLETKYQTEKKQKEIELLGSQKQLSEKEIALLNAQKELDKNSIALLYAQNALGVKEIALLIADKKLAALNLFRESEKRNALERENALQDSVLENEKAFSQLVSREKEKETALNASLGRENILKETELEKEKKLRWTLMAGAGVLLLSGITIFTLYRKQKNKNTIIQKQATDLEVLMKEIHHRVKNNLQVVSSLLDLQSHTITDSQASAAVKEGKNRVQSMALIHQNLYSEGNIKGIMVKEYISNLVQSLSDSYNISNDKVKVNINIDDLNLDVDTMIPLGLVLNELVSNSFKYAFKQTTGGILNIMLEEKNEKLHLMVSDNGSGFPADVDVKSAKSFGLKMIKAFAQKLKATLDIYNNNGAVVEMQISKFKAA
jgi:two-component sensor histidine kinase